MFDFPKQAEFNRLLPKSKVYELPNPRAPFATASSGRSGKSSGNTNSPRKPSTFLPGRVSGVPV
jgi:hypothetical protein